jgi:hypothetical protein
VDCETVLEQPDNPFRTCHQGGTAGPETVMGTDGRDTCHGRAGDDYLEGAGGDDNLFGDDGNDQLFGRKGNDRMSGGNGDDRLEGGRGRDRLNGGPGNDTINGGLDHDSIDCGPGDDTVVASKTDAVRNCEHRSRFHTRPGPEGSRAGPERLTARIPPRVRLSPHAPIPHRPRRLLRHARRNRIAVARHRRRP